MVVSNYRNRCYRICFEIYLPNKRIKKFKTFPFKKQALNRFNSHLLGLSCFKDDYGDEVYLPLPDGIYTFCLKSGYEGIENTKFYLKTDLFKQEFAKVMIKDGIEYNKDFIEYMMQVKFLVEVAKSHAMLGDFVKAQRFFEDAKKKLRKYVECKNCIQQQLKIKQYEL